MQLSIITVSALVMMMLSLHPLAGMHADDGQCLQGSMVCSH